MAFLQYIGEMVGACPRLSKIYAGTLLNRAWRRTRDMRIWSWSVVADSQLFVPAQIVGTCTFTYGSNFLTNVDSVSAALINTAQFAGSGVPPVASPTLGIGRQIRATGQVSTLLTSVGPYYNIVAWDGVSTLTLDRPYGEGSGAGLGYQIVRAFYAAPAAPPTAGPNNYDTSAIRYTSITNVVSGYTITGRSLYLTQAQLNTYDPQRGNGQGGDAYAMAFLGRNALGQQVNELYPTPTNPSTYKATYIARWADLSPSVDLPQVPYELVDNVLESAHALAAGWALGNVGTYPELQNTNWVAAIGMHQAEAKNALVQCVKMDSEIMPSIPILQGKRIEFPLGGQFVQSHDISSLLGV